MEADLSLDKISFDRRAVDSGQSVQNPLRSITRAHRLCSPQAIDLVRFIVETFRLHDDEVQKLHAPFTAFAILDRVAVSCLASRNVRTSLTRRSLKAAEQSGKSSADLNYSKLSSAIQVAIDLLREIPPNFYHGHTDHLVDAPPEHFGTSIADALYDASDVKSASLPEVEGRELLAGGIASSLRMVERASATLSRNSDASLSAYLLSTISLASLLVDTAGAALDELRIAWTPETWFKALVTGSDATGVSISNFPLHSALVGLALKLTQSEVLEPRSSENRDKLSESLASRVRPHLSALIDDDADAPAPIAPRISPAAMLPLLRRVGAAPLEDRCSLRESLHRIDHLQSAGIGR